MGRDGLITIRLSPDEEEVKVLFKDDGLGLPQEETEHIFERSYQGTNKTEGHGHGLYMVKSIIEAHSGDVYAESQEGRGMAIYITLPRNLS